MEISKWAGWLLTVVISLVAAVAASSARVATAAEKESYEKSLNPQMQ